jgi:2,3-oxidosqualene cyclase
VTNALDLGMRHLLSRQREDGSWEGEMVWCTMILSQYIIVKRITGHSFDECSRDQMVKYFRISRTADGVWGMHPESGGYVFFTTLAYVALRLLGLSAEDPLLSTSRHWLHAQKGGVLSIPGWGKFWLALLDLYPYEGIHPLPPEIVLLSKRVPFHPHHYYCHTRLIYLAMAYLYGSRVQANLGSITNELRLELYGRPYAGIDFKHHHPIAETDIYVRPSSALRFSFKTLRIHEALSIGSIRRRALSRCFEAIVAEQKSTQYQALSPVNGLLNCLAIWSRDRHDPELRSSLAGMEKWKWEDDREGIRYVGARSQTWDTAFASMALLESPLTDKTRAALRRAYRVLRDTQLTSEIRAYRDQDRDPALGGWCFSDGEHQWPVSDCTAEALSALLRMHEEPVLAIAEADRIPDSRIQQAVDFMLRRQNDDGGFGTYERRRGSAWLETMNPSEMFGQCMTERSYIECTGSSIAALAHVRTIHPALRTKQLEQAIDRGIQFLRSVQKPDGSFSGFWGVCFTYGIFHAVKGLRAAGIQPTDPALVRAAEWLQSKQRADGGWGEHYSSCLEDRYVEHPQSQVVMTSWALLALMEIVSANVNSVRRGIDWLSSKQNADGSWPQQAVNGVFFGSAMLDYRLYKSYFPTWALARAQR